MPELILAELPYGSLDRASERAYVIRMPEGKDEHVSISDNSMRVNPAGGRVEIVRMGIVAKLLGAFWNIEVRENGRRLFAIGIKNVISVWTDLSGEQESLKEHSRMGNTVYDSKSTHLTFNRVKASATLEYRNHVGTSRALLYFVYMLDYHHVRLGGHGGA